LLEVMVTQVTSVVLVAVAVLLKQEKLEVPKHIHRVVETVRLLPLLVVL
jgi:hypothetical protein